MVTLFIIFMLGTITGSFLNVVIYRVPRGISVIKPGSHCTGCKTPLRPLDLIPLASYLLTGGRCRYCGEGISMQYPLVEIITGLLFVTVHLKFNFPFNIKAFFFVSILITVSAIDIKYYIIPDRVTVVGFLFIIIYLLLVERGQITEAVLGFFVCALPLLFLAFIYPGGMGGGDIKLAALIGSFLGWKPGLISLFLASFFGASIALILLSLKFVDRKTPLPFGPFLAVGAFVSMMWGRELIVLYQNFFL